MQYVSFSKFVYHVVDVEENYKHDKMFYSSGAPMELDVYIPELHLALEYQGQQHYQPTYWRTDFVAQKHRDKEKQDACKRVNSPRIFFQSIVEWNHLD